MIRVESRRRSPWITVLKGAGLAALLIAVDATFDVLVLHHDTFREELLRSDSVEIWTRSLLGFIGIAFVLLYTRRRRTAEQLLLFSEVVESAQDGMQIVALDGRILYSNPAVERMYGFTSAEYVGHHVNEMNADPEFANRVILPAVQSTGKWTGEVEVKHKDGHTFPVLLTAALVKDARGRPVALMGIIRDLTKRKHQEQALRASEERFRRIFEDGPMGMGIIGPSGHFVLVNPALCALSGYTLDELLARTNRDITHPEDVNLDARQLEQLFAGKLQHFRVQKRFRRQDGGILWVSVSVSALPDEEGPPLLALAMMDDVTQETLAREELVAAKERAEAADRMKSEFLDIASHELRTPLAALRLNVQHARVRLDRGQPIEGKTLERVERQTQRLADMISDLLDASRLERGRMTMNPVPVDLGALVSATVEEFRPRAPDRAIELSLPEAPVPITADPQRLEQVIANFLDNAVKYSAAGTPISVRLEAGSLARLSVCDRGIGIPKSQQPRLFERFFRVTTEEARRIPGMGLGLYICRMIIRAHGGEIGVESEPGRGSTFFFTIPESAAASEPLLSGGASGPPPAAK